MVSKYRNLICGVLLTLITGIVIVDTVLVVLYSATPRHGIGVPVTTTPSPSPPTRTVIGNVIAGVDEVIVNRDIVPGEYRIVPRVAGCYWQRLANTDLQHPVIIETAVDLRVDIPAVVRIRPDDGMFVSRCVGYWELLG